MDACYDLLEKDEDARMVDEDRASKIYSRLIRIGSSSEFLTDSGLLNRRFIAAVLSSCFLPRVRDTVLQHDMRGLVADATFSVGDLMTLWDAVPYFCWQRTPRERSLIRQMMRSVYIEYDQDTDVSA